MHDAVLINSVANLQQNDFSQSGGKTAVICWIRFIQERKFSKKPTRRIDVGPSRFIAGGGLLRSSLSLIRRLSNDDKLLGVFAAHQKSCKIP